MNVRDIVYTLFEIFSKSISDDPFNWKPSEVSDKSVDRFIELWWKRGVHKESIGVVFLYDYFCDSYNMWTEMGKKMERPKLINIIGAPQLKRWDARLEEYQYLYTVGFLSKANIPTLAEIKLELIPNTSLEINFAEELERRRFHNTSQGFLHCITLTSMCKKGSEWCNKCDFKNKCIEELKIRDASTALLRGFINL